MSNSEKCIGCSKPIISDQDIKKMKEFSELLAILPLLPSVEEKNMNALAQTVKEQCTCGHDVELLAAAIHKFCLQNKVTSEIGPRFCQCLGDFAVEDKKLRTIVLRKLQNDYIGAAEIYEERERFIQNVRVLYGFFRHVRPSDGKCFKCFTQALVEYFEMLLTYENDSQIETFNELVPKCYQELKEHQPNELDKILKILQKKIITSESELNRILLLETLEQIVAPDVYNTESVISFYKKMKEKCEKV